jgi:hypothetical protein
MPRRVASATHVQTRKRNKNSPRKMATIAQRESTAPATAAAAIVAGIVASAAFGVQAGGSRSRSLVVPISADSESLIASAPWSCLRSAAVAMTQCLPLDRSRQGIPLAACAAARYCQASRGSEACRTAAFRDLAPGRRELLRRPRGRLGRRAVPGLKLATRFHALADQI